jgi:SpoIIAA-like
LTPPRAGREIAIVSGADWLEHRVKSFGWLIPGEIKVFHTDEIDDAKKWFVAGRVRRLTSPR